MFLHYALYKFFHPKHPFHSILYNINFICAYYCNGMSVSYQAFLFYTHCLHKFIIYLNHVFRKVVFDCYIFRRFEVFIISVAGSIFLFSDSHAKQCMEAIRYWNLFYCFVIFQEMFDKAKCPIRDKNCKKRQKNVCTGFRNVRTFVLHSTASKSCPGKKTLCCTQRGTTL